MRSLRAWLASIFVVGLVGAGLSPAQAIPAPGSITGTVTLPAGYDPRDVLVQAHPTAGGSGASAYAHVDGTFELANLAPGQYHLAFATYHHDLRLFDGLPAWWTSPGVVAGRCPSYASCTDLGTLTVESDQATLSGVSPVLSYLPRHQVTGTLVAPPGRTTAGVELEVWLYAGGGYQRPGGWSRAVGIPPQVLGSDGAYSFEIWQGYWDYAFALRAVDPSGTYAFSFANQGLHDESPGIEEDFGPRSVGLHKLPTLERDHRVDPLRLKLPLTAVSGSVNITGVPEWGRTLTAVSDVVWSDPTVGTSYRWYRDGVALDGATGRTYTGNEHADGWGAEMSVRAVPAGDYALIGAPIESARVVVTNTTPFNRAVPTVSGRPRVGSVLRASTGSWTPTIAPFTYTYQWYRGALPIAGATASTYRLVGTDAGHRVRVRVGADKLPTHPSERRWFPAGPAYADSAQLSTVRHLPTMALKARTIRTRAGKRVRITVTLRAGGRATAGRVVLRDGSKVLRTVTVKGGKAVRTVRLSKGRHRLSATVVPSQVLEFVTAKRTHRVR